MSGHCCRICSTELRRTLVDLGVSPIANAYLEASQLDEGEPFYPLHVYVCESCFLVQLGEFQSPAELFSDYAYFSSYSSSWLQHAASYAEEMISRFGLDSAAQVVEVASNDGYLLRNFKHAGIPVLGIEPAANVARVAEEQGIETVVEFFSLATANSVRERHMADLLIANNVLAHVPDVNDFVAGLARIVKPGGVITIEFPHVVRLIEGNQFDTIYHEHFSYFSLYAVERLLARRGLTVFDVDELTTHGGSLRIYAELAGTDARPATAAVSALRAAEDAFGVADTATYGRFAVGVERARSSLLRFLIDARDEGKTVVGYGAPAKGNTLLNYCGVKPDLLPYTVDRSPHKHGRFLPGTRIPIHAPEKIAETKPDFVLILPWNLRTEITSEMSHVRDWGGRFVVAIPATSILT